MDRSDLARVRRGRRGYQEALSATWYPIEIELPGSERDFKAAIASREIGRLRITRAYANAAFRSHRKCNSAGDQRQHFVLHLTQEGSIALSQDGRTTFSGPETLVLMDASAPLVTEQMGAATALALTMPSALLRAQLRDIDSYCISAVSAASGSAAILRDFMIGIWREQGMLTANDAHNLPVALIRLVSAVFQNISGEDKSAAYPHSALKYHFTRLEELLEREIGNFDLTPDQVARRLGISKSYLYAITSQAGTSFGRLLMERRLDRACQMLADPAAANRSITDIAFSVGFQDLSHFSRRFHERFGASPKPYRDRVLNVDGYHTELPS